MFFVAPIPEVTIHIGLERHLEKCHVLLDEPLINPSIQVLETQDDLVLGDVGIVIKQVEPFRSKSRRSETVQRG